MAAENAKAFLPVAKASPSQGVGRAESSSSGGGFFAFGPDELNKCSLTVLDWQRLANLPREAEERLKADSLALAIRERVVAILAGDASLPGFHDWLVGETWIVDECMSIRSRTRTI